MTSELPLKSLNIVFAGTPPFAAALLKALIEANFPVAAVYSQPDREAGRGKKVHASAVKEVAVQHQIAVYQPLNFKKSEDIAELIALKPDVIIVVAYGLLLPQSVLDIPTYGCINVHASLLPRWRGAAPIERAIEAGDATTGITIMQMDSGLDTGAMLNVREIPISDTCTGDSLREGMLAAAGEALIETINNIQRNLLKPITQDSTYANYAHKLNKEEAHIDWQLPALILDRKIRAFNSANVCFSLFAGERIKIWQANSISLLHKKTAGEIISVDKKSITVACGEGALVLHELQLPNAKKMSVSAILNGKQGVFIAGKHFD